VGQIEMPRDGFAGVGFARARSGKREGIGHGQRAILHDILAGLEVPPEIGIVNLG
jgi:hypothetical protein